jgi:hypothetical protein
VRGLSGDIALKPGELRIEFYGAEDLAAKLFELSHAMANDWQAFARAVEEESPPASTAEQRIAGAWSSRLKVLLRKAPVQYETADMTCFIPGGCAR